MSAVRDQWIPELVAELREVFDNKFRILEPASRWEVGADESSQSPFDNDALERIRRSGQWACQPDAVSGHWLALPTNLPDQSTVVALGHVDGVDMRWLGRMANLFCAERKTRMSMVDAEEQVAASLSQISHDFEELTYLRFLAEQIEICDVTRDVNYVIERVLGRLQTVIGAQTLVLIPSAALDGDGAKPFLRFGAASIADEHLLELVRGYRTRAEEGPVVRNVGFSAERSLGPGIFNLLCVQLAKDSTRLGWLLAVNRRPTAVSPRELQNGFGTVEAGLMQVTALMLATHGRNVELFKETEALSVGIVRALVSAVEARDSYTRGHSERVALLGRRLAQEVGLSPDECERIFIAGLLHDVGKIGVADEVLRKPGKLTDEEFDEIKKHPDIGYSILAGLKQIEYLLPGVLYHHERIDGAGYPDGLSGDEIPLQARILAVADSWDAMTSARPYREPMPRAKVESIIAGGSGSQWDPQIVEAFLGMLADVDEICAREQTTSLTVRRRNSPAADTKCSQTEASAIVACATEAAMLEPVLVH